MNVLVWIAVNMPPTCGNGVMHLSWDTPGSPFNLDLLVGFLLIAPDCSDCCHVQVLRQVEETDHQPAW
jgi:hypothetical protein